MRLLNAFLNLGLILAISSTNALAEQAATGLERASGENLATAVGHYARARSLLIAAIREFDAGYKLANPNVLLDSNEWRATLVDRAQDLDKVLDPQPRLTKSGVKYQADSRLLLEAKK